MPARSADSPLPPSLVHPLFCLLPSVSRPCHRRRRRSQLPWSDDGGNDGTATIPHHCRGLSTHQPLAARRRRLHRSRRGARTVATTARRRRRGENGTATTERRRRRGDDGASTTARRRRGDDGRFRRRRHRRRRPPQLPPPRSR